MASFLFGVVVGVLIMLLWYFLFLKDKYLLVNDHTDTTQNSLYAPDNAETSPLTKPAADTASADSSVSNSTTVTTPAVHDTEAGSAASSNYHEAAATDTSIADAEATDPEITDTSSANDTATTASEPVESMTVDVDDLKADLPKAEGEADDLKKIKGIGPKLEQTLNDLSIKTFKQVALLSELQCQQVAIAIKTFPDRIFRDEWVSQAKALHAEIHGEQL